MRGYSPGTHELPGAVASSSLDHFSEVPFAPWCSFPSCPCRSSSLRCCPSSLSCLRSADPAPGGLPRPATCAAGRLASPPAASAGPRAGAGSTSSKPWGRGTLPAGEGPRRETRGEVLITVDGAPLDGGVSLAVRNPSPTGPAWGYGGSGPIQLALAILLAGTDEATAERFYQPFPWSVIAPIEAVRWALDTGDVLGGLEVGGRFGRTTSCTWRWTRVVRAGCLGTQRICPAAVRPPRLCGPSRAQETLSIRILGFAIPPRLCGERRRGRSAPAVSWQTRVRRSTAGRHAGAHPDVDVRALGCLAAGSRPPARSVGGPARPATRARRGAIVVLQHAGRRAAWECR